VKVVLHPQADTEFLLAQQRYTDASPLLGRRFYDEITSVFRRIIEHPRRTQRSSTARKTHARIEGHLRSASTPLCLRQIPSGLQIHPQSRGGAKGFSQVERGIRRHAPLPANKFIEPRFRPPDLPSKGRLRNSPWLQEFLQENLSRMKRIHRLCCIFLLISRTSALFNPNDSPPHGLLPHGLLASEIRLSIDH
jgi:hypothetical protein